MLSHIIYFVTIIIRCFRDIYVKYKFKGVNVSPLYFYRINNAISVKQKFSTIPLIQK